MNRILTIILLAMSMLSLSAQTEKETVYIDFNPHIARMENCIAESHYMGIEAESSVFTKEGDKYNISGYHLYLYYACDELYTALTPDMYVYSSSGILDYETNEIIDISNLKGEVKEVDGKTVYDFTCDGSDGKKYVIHAEAYLPEVKEEVEMNFKDAYFSYLSYGLIIMGDCGDYRLNIQCEGNGSTYDGTYNYMDSPGAAASSLLYEAPRENVMMLQIEYTITTREDGYLDVRGDILTETGLLIHFYMTNAPEGEAGISSTIDSPAANARKVLRNGRVSIQADGRHYGIDGRSTHRRSHVE